MNNTKEVEDIKIPDLFIPRNRAERRKFAKKARLDDKAINRIFKNVAEEKKQEFYQNFYNKLHQLNEERGNNNEGTHEGN